MSDTLKDCKDFKQNAVIALETDCLVWSQKVRERLGNYIRCTLNSDGGTTGGIAWCDASCNYQTTIVIFENGIEEFAEAMQDNLSLAILSNNPSVIA